jgi:hypothetical protein
MDIGDQEELARRYEHIMEKCEKRYAQWQACEEHEEKTALEERFERLSRLKVKIEEAFRFLLEHPERKRVHLNERDADWQKDGTKGFVVGYSAQRVPRSVSPFPPAPPYPSLTHHHHQFVSCTYITSGQIDYEKIGSLVIKFSIPP